jgi:uncharacterized membrane protein
VEVFRGAVLIAATITMGLVAGVFFAWANAIMPGLRRTDDRTFVGTFQAVDRAIINPLFMACFFGALVLTGLAAGLHINVGDGSVLPWAAAAFVLYLSAVIITVAVNVPLNDAIKAAGNPDRADDLAAVRRRFNEPRWAGWNVVRALVSAAAFGCLAGSLLEYGALS